MSLSVRRAWIEILDNNKVIAPMWVALRKESVDRNLHGGQLRHISHVSLSVRRAWIEIFVRPRRSSARTVALRKESVDRNGKLRNPSRPGKVALRKESVDRNA